VQILIGLFFLIVAGTLIAARLEAISHEKKMHILKIAALVLALLWLYEMSVDHGDTKVRNLYNAFKQGKTIVCKDQKVTPEHFYFETGTESFVSTDEKGPLDGLIYPADECEIESD